MKTPIEYPQPSADADGKYFWPGVEKVRESLKKLTKNAPAKFASGGGGAGQSLPKPGDPANRPAPTPTINLQTDGTNWYMPAPTPPKAPKGATTTQTSPDPVGQLLSNYQSGRYPVSSSQHAESGGELVKRYKYLLKEDGPGSGTDFLMSKIKGLSKSKFCGKGKPGPCKPGEVPVGDGQDSIETNLRDEILAGRVRVTRLDPRPKPTIKLPPTPLQDIGAGLRNIAKALGGTAKWLGRGVGTAVGIATAGRFTPGVNREDFEAIGDVQPGESAEKAFLMKAIPRAVAAPLYVPYALGRDVVGPAAYGAYRMGKGVARGVGKLFGFAEDGGSRLALIGRGLRKSRLAKMADDPYLRRLDQDASRDRLNVGMRPTDANYNRNTAPVAPQLAYTAAPQGNSVNPYGTPSPTQTAMTPPAVSPSPPPRDMSNMDVNLLRPDTIHRQSYGGFSEGFSTLCNLHESASSLESATAK